MPNKVQGNMYQDIDYTWNIIKGPCGYKCTYCSIKKNYHRFNRNPGKLRMDRKEFLYKPKKGKKYFIGSSIDMWHPCIDYNWIYKILLHIRNYNGLYLFQTKNPERYLDFLTEFEICGLKNQIELCTTIESDNFYPQMGNAPDIIDRIVAIKKLKRLGYKTIITIEPVMRFNREIFQWLLMQAAPSKIYIGADSKGCKLEEPSPGDLINLISWLKEIGSNVWNFELVLKDNLKRIIGTKLEINNEYMG